MTKSILYWILLQLLRIVQLPISILFFPLAFPFRHKAYKYYTSDGAKWYHPLYIANFFFTKNDDTSDYYVGPYWYKRKIKDKTFKRWTSDKKEEPIAVSLKERLVYFYLAFCWCGLRNYMWNIHRTLTKEGRPTQIRIIKSKTYPADSIPTCKFRDYDDVYRDNSGPRIIYPYLIHFYKKTTVEGLRISGLYTPKSKNERFCLNYVKLLPIGFLRLILVIEIKLGWSEDSGWSRFHFKVMPKKLEKTIHKFYLQFKN